MQAILVMLLITCLLILLFVAPIYFSSLNKFTTYLSKNNTDEWVKLGAPLLTLSGGVQNTSGFLSFIGKRGYLPLRDETLSKLGERTRSLLYVNLFVIGVMFADVFFIMLIPGA